MPQTIRTTGDRGLDRELDALRDALRRVSSVPSPASPGTIEQSPFGPYVRSIAEQPNSGASGDITFTDSGGTEITQADQNFDFSSPPLCDDPPEDVAKITTLSVVASDTFTEANGTYVCSFCTHSALDVGGTWFEIREGTLYNKSIIWSNKLRPGALEFSALSKLLVAITTLTGNEYTIRAKFATYTGTPQGTIGFAARSPAISPWTPRYEVRYTFDNSMSAGEWKIYTVTGSEVFLEVTDGGSTTFYLTPDTEYTCEFRVTNARKSLYIGATEVCWTDDNTITGAGSSEWYPGIHLSGAFGGSADQATWPSVDDFEIEIGVDSDPQGDSTYISRCDHVHEGAHSIARRTASGTAGTALTGDVVLQEDGGIVLNETVASSRVNIAEGFWRDLLTMGI